MIFITFRGLCVTHSSQRTNGSKFGDKNILRHRLLVMHGRAVPITIWFPSTIVGVWKEGVGCGGPPRWRHDDFYSFVEETSHPNGLSLINSLLDHSRRRKKKEEFPLLFYLLSCCDDVCFAARAYYAMAVFFSSSFSFATPPSTTTAGGAGPQAEGVLVCRTISGVSLMCWRWRAFRACSCTHRAR